MAAGYGLYRLACLLGLFLAIQGGEAVKCQTKDGLTIFQVLQQSPNVTVFTSLIQQAKMIPTFNNKATQLTIFVPLDYAFGNLLPLGKGFYDIFPGVDIPRVLVNYHLAIPAIPPKKLKEDLDLTAGLKDAKGNLMKFNTSDQADPLKPYVVGGAVNTANITRSLGKRPGLIACNSVIYFIDEVLLPTKKMIVSKKPKVTINAAAATARTFEPLVTPRKPGEEVEDLTPIVPAGGLGIDAEEDPLLLDDEEDAADPLVADEDEEDAEDPLLLDDEEDAADPLAADEDEADAKKPTGGRSAGK